VTIDWTALMHAAYYGRAGVVATLLGAGAAVDAPNKYGETALHHAAYYGHVAAMAALLGAGAAVDAPNEYDMPALHVAAMNGHVAAVAALVDAGAAVDVQNEFGRTALHLAAINGHAVAVAALVWAGAAVDAHAKDGFTALMYALKNNRTECVSVLTAPATRKTNVLARTARFAALGGDGLYGVSDLYESLFERVLLAVESRLSLAECRLVCTTWRNLSDDTLFKRPVEFFAPAVTAT
jgi:ankyrin repeat protein